MSQKKVALRFHVQESKIINIGRWLWPDHKQVAAREASEILKVTLRTLCTQQTTYLLASGVDAKLGLPPRLCGPESRSWGTPPTRILVVFSLRLLGIFCWIDYVFANIECATILHHRDMIIISMFALFEYINWGAQLSFGSCSDQQRKRRLLEHSCCLSLCYLAATWTSLFELLSSKIL